MTPNVWYRRYPPLATTAVGLMLAVFTLPSALNLPQANPGQTLEYAPVSGNQGSAPPGGNFAGLGLGSGSGAAGEGGAGSGAGAGTVPQPPSNTGASPSSKQCVGNPPRQTEDPMSPPCVAFFAGDNGGKTARGVTGDEVRVLFYLDGGGTEIITSEGVSVEPTATYVDLAAPPSSSDHIFVRVLRTWQSYFNSRFQTYGRKVHFWAYFGSGANGYSPEARRADAAQNVHDIDPFAVVSFLYLVNNESDYMAAMAAKGVLTFGAGSERQASFYSQDPGQLWSFWPSIEEQARVFNSYLCKRVVPYPVSFSGNQSDTNKPRKFGLVYFTDPAFPELTAFANLVRQGVQACGGAFADEEAIPSAPGNYCCNSSNASGESQAMARFKSDQVTTVIWAGGGEPSNTKAAAALAYVPEWVISDPMLIMESNDEAQQNDQTEMAHTWTVTPVTLVTDPLQTPCHLAYRATDTAAGISDDDITYYACLRAYKDIMQLFTGIQVAGPHLTVTNVNQGFRAIPPHQSNNPSEAACYYDPGDYTCVKDAIAEYWDSNTADPGQSGFVGCWRAAEGGRRHRAGDWPSGDVPHMDPTSAPCNTFRDFSY